MNRFLWMVRREVWENKAIWIAPATVIACLFVLLILVRAHLGYDFGVSLSSIPREGQIHLHQFAYSIITAVIFLVMGVVGFFYCIDSLYADRADRSVLFWKSLPLSDAETVLSKFATGAVVVPVVALAGSVVAQIAIGGGVMAKFAMAGQYTGYWLHPETLAGGALLAMIACAGAILWYAPLVAYLMLVSAWAPRAPFLWAVLPPIAAVVLERVVMQTSYVEHLVLQRLLGMYEMLGSDGEGPGESEKSLGEFADQLTRMDWHGRVQDYFTMPELWLGLVAAAVLLAAAMWVRRYRDETS